MKFSVFQTCRAALETSGRRIARKTLRKIGLKRDLKRDILMFLQIHRIDLVVDVGANSGQFASDLREKGYTGEILSFEPVASVFKLLQARIGRDQRWNAVQCALGSKSGEAQINVSETTQYSSFKSISSIASEVDKRTHVQRTEIVRVDRLDAVLAHHTAKRIFLKIDTQGFEKEVLDGSVEILPRVFGLLIEAPVDHLYNDVWDFHDALLHMWKLGFSPSQINPVNPTLDDPSSAIEFDVVFRRRRDLDQQDTLSSELYLAP